MSHTSLLHSQCAQAPQQINESVATSGGDDTLPGGALRQELILLQECESDVDDFAKVALLLTVEDGETGFELGVGYVTIDDTEEKVQDGMGGGGIAWLGEGGWGDVVAIAVVKGGGRAGEEDEVLDDELAGGGKGRGHRAYARGGRAGGEGWVLWMLVLEWGTGGGGNEEGYGGWQVKNVRGRGWASVGKNGLRRWGRRCGGGWFRRERKRMIRDEMWWDGGRRGKSYVQVKGERRLSGRVVEFDVDE